MAAMISIRAHIPNFITLTRIILVIPIILLLWRNNYFSALILMVIASLSDALDGWLARRFDWRSSFGAAIDPLADKLLIGGMFLVFWFQDHIPTWLVFIVLFRDILILAGALAYRYLFEEIKFSPTKISKANTAVQVTMLILLLIKLCDVGAISDAAGFLVEPYCFFLLGILGVFSGIDYVLTWGLRAWRNLFNE